MDNAGSFLATLLIGGAWGWYFGQMRRHPAPVTDARVHVHDEVSDMAKRVHTLNRIVPHNSITMHFTLRSNGKRFKMTINEVEACSRTNSFEGRE